MFKILLMSSMSCTSCMTYGILEIVERVLIARPNAGICMARRLPFGSILPLRLWAMRDHFCGISSYLLC
jgi:hypothetical protein